MEFLAGNQCISSIVPCVALTIHLYYNRKLSFCFTLINQIKITAARNSNLTLLIIYNITYCYFESTGFISPIPPCCGQPWILWQSTGGNDGWHTELQCQDRFGRFLSIIHWLGTPRKGPSKVDRVSGNVEEWTWNKIAKAHPMYTCWAGYDRWLAKIDHVITSAGTIDPPDTCVSG